MADSVDAAFAQFMTQIKDTGKKGADKESEYAAKPPSSKRAKPTSDEPPPSGAPMSLASIAATSAGPSLPGVEKPPASAISAVVAGVPATYFAGHAPQARHVGAGPANITALSARGALLGPKPGNSQTAAQPFQHGAQPQAWTHGPSASESHMVGPMGPPPAHRGITAAAAIGMAGPPSGSAATASIGPALPSASFVASGAADAAVVAALAERGGAHSASAAGSAKAKRRDVRVAAGKVWVDESLNEWPENDFRLFVGDLAPEADDACLSGMFSKYPTFAKAKVIFDKTSKKSKGFGFVSMLDVMDAAKAIRDLNRKYLLSRPMTVRWSSWQKRSLQSLSADDRKEQMDMVKATQSMNPIEARKEHLRQRKRHEGGGSRGRGRGRGRGGGRGGRV